ncbi:MAG: hypothetical protein KH353_10015 [Clostridium sp.]|nr:hypothetical protein [Clostridium sp.]
MYHIFLLETDREEELKEEISEYLEQYLSSDTVYGMKKKKLEVADTAMVTDNRGEPLEEEIVDYMKYGIWTAEGNETDLEELADTIRSADGIAAVKEVYQISSDHVFHLEEALEDIRESLEKQKNYEEEGKRELENCQGRAFIKTGKKLAGEMERMPVLAEKYDRAAALLESELDASEQEAEKQRKNMGEEEWKLIKEQTDSYRAYTDKEGERRGEVERIKALTMENRGIVDSAIEMAEETQDYIDSWEADDEDDELDEEELWDNVLSVFNRCKITEPSYQRGIADKKRLNILEKIGKMTSKDLLDLTLPEGIKPSVRKMDMSDFPSGGNEGYEMGIRTTKAGELADRMLVSEYAAAHFLKFQVGEESEEENRLCYEQEYLLNGKKRDRDNLHQMVKKLIGVREGMNLLHILGDSEKRSEARLLAASLTGSASVTPIADIVAFFIMGVWAFAESVEDVRALLEGEKVPLMKNSSDWKLDLDELFRFVDKQEKIHSSGGKTGLDYGQYLKGFFLIQNQAQRNERMLDMIQYNLSGKQKSFRMGRCAVGMNIECTVSGTAFDIRKNAQYRY